MERALVMHAHRWRTAPVSRHVGRLLQWCFVAPVGASAPSTSSIADETMRGAANHHRAWGVLHAHRDALDHLSPAIRADAADRHRAAATQHVSLHADLAAAGRVWDAAGLEWVVVKGPALAERVYESPWHRHFTDLDVLVRPADLRAAISVLTTSGWTLLDRNWDLARARMLGEVHLAGPYGTMLDLHWSLQNRAYRRERLPMTTTELIAAAVPTTLRGTVTRVLDPVDTLVHLALHAAGDGGDRLIWLSDLARSAPTVRPDELRARAALWGALPTVSTMLARADTVFPSHHLRELHGAVAGDRSTRLVDRFVDVVWPVASAPGRTRGLARMTQARLEPRQRARVHLVSRRTPFVDSPTEPASLLFESGGRASREAFLDAVGRHR